MIEGPLIFLIFIFVILVAAGLFALWVIGSIARGIVNLVIPRRGPVPLQRLNATQRCQNADCRTDNPPQARFCRRCGQSLPMLMKAFPRSANDTAAA